MNRYTHIYVLASLSGLISLTTLVSIASASLKVAALSENQIISAKEEDSALRQGLPGRRLNGGTRVMQAT